MVARPVQSRNPFDEPRRWRQEIIEHVKLSPAIRFTGRGFICALINSRCPVGCEHCMFFSNMSEAKNANNTMTRQQLSNLMNLVRDSNTGYLLVSGGGEGFLEPDLMCRIVEETTADITWMVTSAHWARSQEAARRMVRRMYEAFLRGKHQENDRRICVRVSVDSHHVLKLQRSEHNRLQYVVDLIRVFEAEYASDTHFFLMIHSLKGDEALIDELCSVLHGQKVARHDSTHDEDKITESALTIRLESGYELEATFAKLLLADLAADIRDEENLEKRIQVFERDAFINQRGNTGVKFNPNGSIGPNMLVIYNGRVAGGWQCEMPDVPINLDSDDFSSIMRKTLTDPGVLGTIENGLAYRFGIIHEVCPKAVTRSKAVNVRDYTSPVLLEEDRVKLYYSLRVLQDYLAKSRVSEIDMLAWPETITRAIRLSHEELRSLYRSSKYDIVQQFIADDSTGQFHDFVRCIKQYASSRNADDIVSFFRGRPAIPNRVLDKWRLLLRRTARGWYDIYTLDRAEVEVCDEIEAIIEERVASGGRPHEDLSMSA